MIAATGFPESVAAQLRAWQVRPSDTPELERYLLDPGVRVYELDDGDPFIHQTLTWLGGRPLPPLDPDLPARLRGLADQGAIALHRARLTDRVRHQALHDALTGLPNQALFTDRLQQALAAARRNRRHPAVAFLDLNRFKQVNDTLGHPAGDTLLRQVAARLADTIRSTDTVARLGGDEFTILFTDLEREEQAFEAAEQLGLETDLHQAVDGGQRRVLYQPQVALASGRVVGAEALVRWAEAGLP